MLKKIARYAYFGYTIVTQDESHFKDAKLSVRYWENSGTADTHAVVGRTPQVLHAVQHDI